MPNSAQLRSSVSTCTRESSSLIRAATGVPSVGVLWSAVASVRSGRRTLRPARRSPSNACGLVTSWTRCRSMYRSPSVADLVGLPDLLEHRLGHSSAPPEACRHDREEGRVVGGRVLEVVRQVGVEGDACRPRRARSGARRRRARRCPSCTSAVSRLPGSWIGGSPSGAPVEPPGPSVWRESSARWPGWEEVSTSKRWPRRALPPRRRSPARTTVTAPCSSRRSSCERRSSGPRRCARRRSASGSSRRARPARASAR